MSATNEYLTPAHANAYLQQADGIPHRHEGEAVVLELLPEKLSVVMDLGTGDGRLLALIKANKDVAQSIATDFSPTMLNHAPNPVRVRPNGRGHRTRLE